jgi:hypothetical protein
MIRKAMLLYNRCWYEDVKILVEVSSWRFLLKIYLEILRIYLEIWGFQQRNKDLTMKIFYKDMVIYLET